MAIKARLLKSSEIPERVSLYEVRESRTVVVEEAHSDDSLDQASQYEAIPDLGVITRSYNEQRMVRLRDDYQKHCHNIANNYQGLSLAQRKKRPDIAKYKGVWKAAQAILDREFQTEDGTGTYRIHIRLLSRETRTIC